MPYITIKQFKRIPRVSRIEMLSEVVLEAYKNTVYRDKVACKFCKTTYETHDDECPVALLTEALKSHDV